MADGSVSLYVPCYNVERHLERCVYGILGQTRVPDEILLVDDGSRDGTLRVAERLARLDPRIQVISHAQNQGLAATRNSGLRHARGEFVAALDADTCPDPHWLETLLPHFRDPQVALVGGPLIESAIHGLADRWRRAAMTQAWGKRRVRNPLFMYGHSQVIRRDAALAVGGYDESMRTNGEDMDMTRKLRSRGFDCIYDPAATVRHYRTDTLASIFDTYWRYWLFGNRWHLTKPSARDSMLRTSKFFLARCKAFWDRGIPWYQPDVLALDLVVPFYMTYRQLRLQWRGR
jgi:cellulose synthase/poly-beta-1,6-N-acetylglucosamine synthase-like glycosyltransferase